MPPPDARRGRPADWLRYAYSDLDIAALDPGPRMLLETLCYHCQQAAEKALKAVLIADGVEPPRTHNLGHLLAILSRTRRVPDAVAAASSLTDYAVEARYPDNLGEVSEAEWQAALGHARAVVAWAEAVVGSGG